MTTRVSRHARWCAHVNGVRASRAMSDWLTDTGSLTIRLTACSNRFQVRCLHQQRRRALADECPVIGLPSRQPVHERDVLLLVDGKPVVYGHTVVPATCAADWPFFGALGERSLGSRLFSDPLVRRGPLQYARLHVSHPLMRRAASATGDAPASPLFARRRLFRRGKGLLLVTELFLPAIAELTPAVATNPYAEKQSNQ